MNHRRIRRTASGSAFTCVRQRSPTRSTTEGNHSEEESSGRGVVRGRARRNCSPPAARADGTSDNASDPAKLTNCTNKIMNDRRPAGARSGPGTRTWPRSSTTSTTAHNDVQVCWTNVGQGNDEYAKFQTAISAGNGRARRHHARGRPAPELRDPEGARRPRRRTARTTSRTTSATAPGRTSRAATRSTRSRSTAARWRMIYRTDVFEKYGITPADHVGRVRAGGAEGQGCRRPALRRLRQQRARRRSRP